MQVLSETIKQFWGFDGFLPLQREAMASVMKRRDSLVVLPTGGGKSLCFQAPAVTLPGMAVVVSPLISLMKDQVDQLNACGVAAACIHSGMDSSERFAVHEAVRGGRLHLLYVAPERVVQPNFIEYLRSSNLSFVVIDEAHCISQWGHDFRPEYRALRTLREAFPDIHMHAYTATATDHVRQDIVTELGLRDPEVLVGSFDRPNLVYRARPRSNAFDDVRAIVERRKGDAGIVYCIRRKDVDALCARLSQAGCRVLPYHAGLSDADRKSNQEAFSRDEADIVVATVAFGMGIDKSNVRYVIHAGMPKSIEHYQQESGRAGRDGLEAECWVFYSGGDYGIWKAIITQSESAGADVALDKLNAMYRFCLDPRCKHKALLAYFDEEYPKENCGACDVCLEEAEGAENAPEVARTILRCVDELGGIAGPAYTTLVLTGSTEERVISKGHDRLAGYGALREEDQKTVRGWIEQIVMQDLLRKTGEYNVLQVTPKGREALAGECSARLAKAARRVGRRSRAAEESWGDTDMALFEKLRALRRHEAEKRGAPPYVVFSDAALRDMAARKPMDLTAFLDTRGVGQRKCREYGELFVNAIREHEGRPFLSGADAVPGEADPAAKTSAKASRQAGFEQASELFKEGRSIQEVSEAVGRAQSTVESYLERYIDEAGVSDASPWVPNAIIERVRDAAAHIGGDRLKPIFEHLDGDIGYGEIRIALACLRNGPPELGQA